MSSRRPVEMFAMETDDGDHESPMVVETITIRDDGTVTSASATDPSPATSGTNNFFEEGSSEIAKRGTLTNFVVRETAPRLIHVEYPGYVENPVEAVRTMGGEVNVNQTLANPGRKLELRFRPADVYCNPVLGESETTCGVLIKVRRRKKPKDNMKRHEMEEPKLIGLDYSLPEPPPLSQNPAFISKPKTISIGAEEYEKEIEQIKSPSPEVLERRRRKAQILEEEASLLNNVEEKIFEEDRSKKSNAEIEQVYLKLPPKDFRPARSGLSVEVLGVVNRGYKFKGLCDFQYLPTEFDDEEGCQVSIHDSIAPVFGDPDNDILFMSDTLEPNEEIPLFLVPSVMSRLDKPLTSITSFMDENRTGGDVIRSTRAKRVVYSHNINFRLTDKRLDTNEVLVPRQALPEALADVSKRLLGEPLETVKRAFAKRPIWTKLALEAELGIKISQLKYLVPCVAYFCLNGPWRSLWVRFGFDPRKDKSAFIYQLLDYRIPHNYRPFITMSRKDPESYFAFKPGDIPSKSQMFYQLCDIHMPEVDTVTTALRNRINATKNLEYSPKFGFIDEDTLEYCRYCISRYVEIFLKEQGKIQAITLAELEIPPGATAPKNMVKLGLMRNPNIPRMRSRPKRKDLPRRVVNDEDGTSRHSESDSSSVVGDLTIRGDLFRSELMSLDSLDDEDEDWQDDSTSVSSKSFSTNNDNFDDDDDPVMQEILGN